MHSVYVEWRFVVGTSGVKFTLTVVATHVPFPPSVDGGTPTQPRVEAERRVDDERKVGRKGTNGEGCGRVWKQSPLGPGAPEVHLARTRWTERFGRQVGRPVSGRSPV